MTKAIACRICGNETGNRDFLCQERMFGSGDKFDYFQCGGCQSLQIADPSRDWSKYYSGNYYSFSFSPMAMHGFNAWKRGCRDRWTVTGKGFFGRLFARFRAPREDLAAMRRANLTRESRILDVGCGGGYLLSLLWRAGFRNLAGVDPFLTADVEVTPGLKVRRRPLEEVSEQFDLVMMHHAFEHLVDPEKTLTACHARLRPGGQILLRIPTVDSDAWERYRECWVDLDCPRHLHLFSRRGLEALVARAGFVLKDWWGDSSGFQFWGSELYRRGVTLYDKEGRPTDPKKHFSAEELAGFQREAVSANARNRGDQVAVLLAPRPA